MDPPSKAVLGHLSTLVQRHFAPPSFLHELLQSKGLSTFARLKAISEMAQLRGKLWAMLINEGVHMILASSGMIDLVTEFKSIIA